MLSTIMLVLSTIVDKCFVFPKNGANSAFYFWHYPQIPKLPTLNVDEMAFYPHLMWVIYRQISIPASLLTLSNKISPWRSLRRNHTSAVILSTISRSISPSTGARSRPPPAIRAVKDSTPLGPLSSPVQVPLFWSTAHFTSREWL